MQLTNGAIIGQLEQQAEQCERRAQEIRSCIATLRSFATVDTAKREPPKAAPATKKATKKGGTKPAKKAAKAPAHPVGELEPRVHRGRLPTVDVQSHVCFNEGDRAKFVADLKARGLRRTAPMERLAPGLFDIVTIDGDATILWREPAPAAD